jgi:nucleotide-binding universal stress UspA family protein
VFKEQEQAYLDAITKQLGKTAAVPVTSTLVGGLIEDAILERVRTKPADLIVMTTHGRGPMSRFWLGSVAVELMRHGPVPILLVRPTAVAVSSDCSWGASPTRSCEAHSRPCWFTDRSRMDSRHR